MRKRYPIAVGGGIALLVASQYLNFGLGFREGTGPGQGPESGSQQTKLDSIDEALSNIDPGQTDLGQSDPALPPETASMRTPDPVQPEVVDILIDSNQYWVVTDANWPDQRVVMTLDEVVAMAKDVPGEPSGIRVRVARTPDAVASAEAAILTRLSEAGWNKDQIDSRRQLVEDANLP